MKLRYLAIVAVLTAACSESTLTGGAQTNLRVVNGASVAGNVQVYLDGQLVGSALGVGATSNAIVTTSGNHTLELRKVGSASGLLRTVSLDSGKVLLVALDSGGTLTSSMVSDTNAVVPGGASKLRVMHFAQGAPLVDIWRTQPDFGTPIRIMFPFDYKDVSPYLQSTPGDWRVMVSHRVVQVNDPMPDTLANSGLITVPDGTSKTVLIVDGATAGTMNIVVTSP